MPISPKIPQRKQPDKPQTKQFSQADQLFAQGLALHQQGKLAQAQTIYVEVLKVQPKHFDGLHLSGVIALQTNKNTLALDLIGQAIKLNPKIASAYSSRGNALQELKLFEAAVESHDKAIALKPDYADAYHGRGNALRELSRGTDAVASYKKALEIDPDIEFLLGGMLREKCQICDWDGIEREVNVLLQKIAAGNKCTPCFPLLHMADSPARQKQVGELWISSHHPPNQTLGPLPKPIKRNKIRIAYFSADFRNHAIAHLMAGLFESHDKSKFELFAFSFGPDQPDGMRQRLVPAFDQFIDVRAKTDIEVAQLARQLEIEIAIDLNGFTKDGRPGIFAARAAPIQVNYLGYPGTMAAPYMDYLIADRTLIPETSQQHYTEKIVYLPGSYQVNDSKRPMAEKQFNRKELGLPATGFVFCCFNNSYKITPAVFAVWMHILKRAEGSVLWLLEDNLHATENLRREAEQRGVSSERLIFAPRIHLPGHLARHQLADLFLDTLPYNAHTTASDALWAGLPVLTLMGQTFAGRVAAGLLHAIELPELITHSQEQYESKAIELATNPKLLGEIKQKLARNRLTTPLFNTPLFTKHIEAAYVAMYERYQTNLPPEHIYI